MHRFPGVECRTCKIFGQFNSLDNGKTSLITSIVLAIFELPYQVSMEKVITFTWIWIIGLPQTLPANVPARTNRAIHPALDITASGVSRNITFQSSSHAQKIPPACPSFTSVPGNTTTDLFFCLPHYLFLCIKND